MLGQDIRYAFRRMVRHRGFSLAIILCFGLGIGASCALFSVINTVILGGPPHFDEADRVAVVFALNKSPEGDVDYRASPIDYDAWRRDSQTFSCLEAERNRSVIFIGGGDPERLLGALVSAGFFSCLGVEPMIGRVFTPDEDRPGNPGQVTVISHGLWQRRFGGSRDVLGQKIQLDADLYTIVGVMPPGFRFPESRTFPARDLWMPYGLDPHELPARRWHNILVVGRLAEGVSFSEAQAEMETIAERVAQEFPDTNSGWGARVATLTDAFIAPEVRSGLRTLSIAVGFLLLIACANVTCMMLARATSLDTEVALRSALGVRPARLISQFLTESVVLALVGGVVGLVLAYLFVPVLVSLSSLTYQTFGEIGVDWRVAAFAVGISLIVGITFGLVPALRLSKTDLSHFLREGSNRASGGFLGRRLQEILVVGQIALVLTLLVQAGLVIKSFNKLSSVDPGYRTENILTMRVLLPSSRFPEEHLKVTFIDRVLEAVCAVPGVLDCSVSTVLPIGDPVISTQFSIEGRIPQSADEVLVTNYRQISEDFFETLDIPILEGRSVSPSDGAESPGVVVVSEELARRYWPDRSAIGQRVKRGGPDADSPWLEVVGVAADVRDAGLDASGGGVTMYFPYAQLPIRGFRVLSHTASAPEGFLPAIRQAIWSVDRDQPVFSVITVDEMVADSISQERFNTVLVTVLAVLSLVLASLGIYGVMSYSVNQRFREIGIRMAIGARGAQVLGMVMLRAFLLAVAGLAVGLVATFALTRTFSHLLFEVESMDPLILIVGTVFLMVVALVSTLIPAYRASKVDPVQVLRAE